MDFEEFVTCTIQDSVNDLFKFIEEEQEDLEDYFKPIVEKVRNRGANSFKSALEELGKK